MDRSHFLIAERGWEEISDYVMNWSQARAEPEAVITNREAELIDEYPLLH